MHKVSPHSTNLKIGWFVNGVWWYWPLVTGSLRLHVDTGSERPVEVHVCQISQKCGTTEHFTIMFWAIFNRDLTSDSSPPPTTHLSRDFRLLRTNRVHECVRLIVRGRSVTHWTMKVFFLFLFLQKVTLTYNIPVFIQSGFSWLKIWRF